VGECIDSTLAALESGVRLIDTAFAYPRPGVESFAEAVVAVALRQWRGEPPIVARLADLASRRTSRPAETHDEVTRQETFPAPAPLLCLP
jgi:diketogulonate reductase-like aldo/keto reductase